MNPFHNRAMKVLITVLSCLASTQAFLSTPTGRLAVSSPLTTNHVGKIRFPPMVTNLVQPTSTRLHSSKSLDRDNDKTKPLFDKKTRRAMISAGAFCLGDIACRGLFMKTKWTFPSSLGGTGVLLLTLLALNDEDSDDLYDFLKPGADLLTQWLPVFFVPSLLTLPLTNVVGTSIEYLKVAAVLGGGFILSLATTAGAVKGVRKARRETNDFEDITDNNWDDDWDDNWDDGNKSLKGRAREAKNDAKDAMDDVGDQARKVKDDAKNALEKAGDWVRDAVDSAGDAVEDFAEKRGKRDTPSKNFSETTMYRFIALALVTGILGVIPGVAGLKRFEVPFRTTFFLSTTLATYVAGTRMPKKYKKSIHPLVVCTALTWAAVAAYGAATGASFREVLMAYQARASPSLQLGAGDILLWMLGPSVISFAIGMFDKRKKIWKNLPEIGTAVGVSSLVGLYGTALLVRLLDITSPSFRLALLTRNITSPLAVAVASFLGADQGLSLAMVVITGILGANFGSRLLNQFDIRDKISRGLGMGGAAHGLGAAAMKDEKESFPFAAIAMALTATAATVLTSIPPVQKSLVSLPWAFNELNG